MRPNRLSGGTPSSTWLLKGRSGVRARALAQPGAQGGVDLADGFVVCGAPDHVEEHVANVQRRGEPVVREPLASAFHKGRLHCFTGRRWALQKEDLHENVVVGSPPNILELAHAHIIRHALGDQSPHSAARLEWHVGPRPAGRICSTIPGQLKRSARGGEIVAEDPHHGRCIPPAAPRGRATHASTAQGCNQRRGSQFRRLHILEGGHESDYRWSRPYGSIGSVGTTSFRNICESPVSWASVERGRGS
jgi:hypothetical protein